MAIQPFGIKVKKKKHILTLNQVVTIILSIVLVGSTSYLGWQNNNLQNQNAKLLNKQTNYPIQVFEYPIVATVEGGYANHTNIITNGYGFLNTTFIISTPDITRLIIENCNFEANPYAKYYPFLDHSKINNWTESFDTDTFMRNQLVNNLPDFNNFTYYTTQAGINTFSVSIPIEIDFYMNPSYNFQININPFPLGNITVTANLTDMQTINATIVSFQAQVWASVTIS